MASGSLTLLEDSETWLKEDLILAGFSKVERLPGEGWKANKPAWNVGARSLLFNSTHFEGIS